MDGITGNWTIVIEAACCAVFLRTQRLRFRAGGRTAAFLLVLAAMLGLQQLYLNLPLPPLVTMMINIVLLKLVPMIVLCTVLTEQGVGTGLFVFSEAFVTSELTAALINGVVLTALSALGLNGVRTGQAAVLISVLLCLAVVVWIQHLAGCFVPCRVRPQTALLALAVSYISFGVSFFMGWTAYAEGSPGAQYFSITVNLSSLLILFLLQYAMAEELFREDMRAVQRMLDLRYQQYQDYVENTEYLGRQLHDLKHQMAGLRALGGAELTDYMNEMEQAIAKYETWNVSGNGTLDALMTQKKQFCLAHDIQLMCSADGAALDFLPVRDICTIFGNLLDNASEAVQKLADGDDRIIQVSVGSREDFLLIRVENRCPEGLVLEGDALPATTKADRQEHGIGLRSVRLVVEQHGGTLSLSAENGWFSAGILIPHS